MAIDYRIRFYWPLESLAGLVATKGAQMLTLVAGDSRMVAARGPIVHSDEFRIIDGPPVGHPLRTSLRSEFGSPPNEVAATLAPDYFLQLSTDLTELDPAGKYLSEGAELLLCRHCYILALFEELFRVGLRVRSPLYGLGERSSLDDLLGLPDPRWINDLARMSRRLALSHIKWAVGPAILNPVFTGSVDVAGADGDLIVNGSLLDIKATVNPETMRREWVLQIVGYLLLDYEDEHRLDAAGFYLARQGLSITWPIEQLLRVKSRAQIGELRHRFEELLTRGPAQGGTALPSPDE